MSKQYRVKCFDMDSSGCGLVRFNGSIFHIPNLLPKEMAKIELVHTKTGTFAKLVEIEEPAKQRITPACPHFPKCGGCQLQHLSYEDQLAWKQQKIDTLFAKYCKPRKIIGMKDPSHYRHKIHATLSKGAKGAIISGIYEENTHKVLSIANCNIQDKAADHIMKSIRKLMKKYKLLPYNEDSKKGTLRHVLFRKGFFTNQLMVVLVCGSTLFPSKQEFTKELLQLHPEITTLLLNINSKSTSMILGEKETVLYGKGYIEDKICGYTFRISAKSFYQVNPAQAEILYQEAINAAALTGTETVLDAYCGTGTISLVAAKNCARVIGVELNKDAVKDAIYNAKQNHCKNVTFICKDASVYLRELKAEKILPDVVIMDPPRSGCDSKFLDTLGEIKPKKIVYVSCNPDTLKRDVDFLVGKKYQVEQVQPIDMFPESYHVETIVGLHRQNT